MAKKKQQPAAKGSAGQGRKPAKRTPRPVVPNDFQDLFEQLLQARAANEVPRMARMLDRMRGTPAVSSDMQALLCEAEIVMRLSEPPSDDDYTEWEESLRLLMDDLQNLMTQPDLSEASYGRLLIQRALYSLRNGEPDDFLEDMGEYEVNYEVPLELRAELCRVRANSCLEMDEAEDALAQYEGLLADPELTASMRLSALVDSVPILLEMERLSEAQERLQTVMADPAANPDHRAACLMYLPRTYEVPQDQLTSWNETLKSDLLDAADRGSALYLRHEVHQNLGDDAAATADLLAALAVPELSLDDRHGCLMALGGIYMNEQRYPEALEVLDKLVAETAGDLAEEADFFDEEELAAAVKNFMARVSRAMIYVAVGRLPDAKRELKELQAAARFLPYAQEMLDEVKDLIARADKVDKLEKKKPKRK